MMAGTLAQLVIVALALTLGTAESASAVQRQASIFGIIAEKATLADARRMLGPAEARHNGGDAAASGYFACYVGPDSTALILESNSEMGGGETVTSFQLLQNLDLADFSGLEGFTPSPTARPRCGRTAKLTHAATTGGGLRLGMKRAEAVRALGQRPSGSARAALFFILGDHERPVRAPDGGVIGNPTAWIVLDLERDRVTGIRVTYSSAI
jgi:hypothetical protein